jgi:MinD-like ATPase involved in chromosome partitioning or flagellar assembly
MAKSGIVVTTPEHTALMSTMVFVKNLVLRGTEQSLRKDVSLKDRLNEMYKRSVANPVFTVESFRRQLAEEEPHAAEIIESICLRIRPPFVYNLVESFKDAEVFATSTEPLLKFCRSNALISDRFLMFLHPRILKGPGIFLVDGPKSLTADTN